MGKYMTSKDLSRPEPITGAARIQQLREQERDKIHAERKLAAEVAAELEKETKKNKKNKKDGNSNKAS